MEKNTSRCSDDYGLKNVVSVGGFFIDATEVRGRAQALLNTIQLVNQTLATVEILRKQHGDQINNVDRHWIDVTIVPNAQVALDRVAKLVESARVDMSARQGRISWKAKLLFVLRDGPRVVESMTLLNTAATGLMTAITILRAYHKPGPVMEPSSPEQSAPQSPGSIGSFESPHSPSFGTYSEKHFLKWRRQLDSGPRSRRVRREDTINGISDVRTKGNLESTLEPGYLRASNNDNRPVYTGNDSFIVLSEADERPMPYLPEITLSGPITIDGGDLTLEALSPQSSRPPSLQLLDLSSTQLGNLSVTTNFATETQCLADPVTPLTTTLEESRGRSFLKRQAGIPE